jgi:hypothetical protein
MAKHSFYLPTKIKFDKIFQGRGIIVLVSPRAGDNIKNKQLIAL